MTCRTCQPEMYRLIDGQYHLPTCDHVTKQWGKSADRRTAELAGYEPHSCIQGEDPCSGGGQT